MRNNQQRPFPTQELLRQYVVSKFQYLKQKYLGYKVVNNKVHLEKEFGKGSGRVIVVLTDDVRELLSKSVRAV